MSVSDVIERLLEALNRHDVDGAAAVFALDYRSVQPAHPGREFDGRAQMHANRAAMFAGGPDFDAEVLCSVDDGRTTWSEGGGVEHLSGQRTRRAGSASVTRAAGP